MDLPPTIIIQNDRGGMVGEYITKLMDAKKSGVEVKILGHCASACTIWL